MDMLWIKNTESPKGSAEIPEDVDINVSETTGDFYPMMEVNGYVFKDNEIKTLEFTESGMVPTISATITDDSGAFTNKYYPTSGALMKVYIKSKNQNLKAIRCDFLITSIKGSRGSIIGDGTSEGRGTTYTFSGTLNVPLLTDTVIAAHEGTSFNVLNEVSKEMHLGFATNEISTDDRMVWLQPNITYAEYLDSITKHAYKDEESFFNSFIDRYYNFTFVNLYNMMSQDGDTDAAYYENVRDHESWMKAANNGVKKTDPQTNTVPNQLSNSSNMRGSFSYITNYSIKSNQGKIMMSVPSNERIYYYDYNISEDPDKKFIEYEVKTHDTMNSGEAVNKNYTNQWFGMDSGNIHDNYFFALKSNIRNTIELEKTNMVVDMEGVNLNLLRGMRIPVSIWREGMAHEYLEDTSTQKDRDDEYKDENLQIEYDKKLSGFYIINSLKFKYDSSINGGNRWTTEAVLSRASWEANDEYSV